jgi:small-conductance mechanosensitive channel/CRP-like cAMP-binding protein
MPSTVEHLIVGHLVMGVAALAATLLIFALTTNVLVRRKLRLSIALLAAYLLVHVGLLVRGAGLTAEVDAQLRSFENLAFAAAIINLLVVSLVNPLRANRVPDAFPSILQDALVIGLFVLIATFFFNDRLLTTSAIGAAVVGFALQDTLGNAFAGLAIQSEKPFRIGHWIKVGDFEGQVTEVTWRATRLRTKAGNHVILPNNVVGRDAIVNYSEPALPTRIHVELGATYLASPTLVKTAIAEAMAHVPRVLAHPPSDVLLVGFDDSAITYRARFWIQDYATDELVRDEVRTAIYHAFSRHNIEIPWPITVEYKRPWPEDPLRSPEYRRAVMERVEMFHGLTPDQRGELAQRSAMRTFGDREAIVRQGTPGSSMFVIASGRVAVVLGAEAREVATIAAGGYFGEMSLLTGEPRSATVVARGDTVVLEIDAEVFRALGAADPQALERIGTAAIARRVELEQARAASTSTAVAAETKATLVGRMKRFLGL